MTYLMQKLPAGGKHRLYTDRGDDGLDSLYEPAHRMVEEVLRERGFGADRAMTRIHHGSGHGEADWAARLDEPLLFLLAEP